MGASIATNLQPRIHMACLAAYNSGILHGAAQEPWSIYDEVKAMLAASPVAGAEEWAIHDFEGFGDVRIEECAPFDRGSALPGFIAEHGELGAALLVHCGGDPAEAREAMTSRYLGKHASFTDYMQDATEEGTTIPHAFPIRHNAGFVRHVGCGDCALIRRI